MTLYDLQDNCEIDLIDTPLTVALGCFDGLHMGHRKIIGRALSFKEPCCVFTFSTNLFDAPCIDSPKKKLELFAKLGVRYVCVADFEAVKDMSWSEFAEEVLLGILKAKQVVCGYNFTFGKDACGNAKLLCEYMQSRNLDCIIIDEVKINKNTVSSTAVRQSLSDGDCEKATELLGRPYCVEYDVVHGNSIGRAFGYPTINHIPRESDVKLARGVYICSCMGYPAVTDVGVRPTVVNDPCEVYETFIIGFNGDLYEKNPGVNFYKKIREEKRFPSIEALKEQIGRDVEECKEYFKTHEI